MSGDRELVSLLRSLLRRIDTMSAARAVAGTPEDTAAITAATSAIEAAATSLNATATSLTPVA